MAQDLLNQAQSKVRAAIADQNGWYERKPEEAPHRGGPTSAIEATAYEKIVGKNKDNVDLRLGKASLDIDAPAKIILDVVWNLDNHRPGGWDMATVADQHVIEEIQPGRVQVIYQQHKILSAASAKRDLVLVRGWQQEPNGGYLIWSTSVPSHPKAPKKEGFVRAELLYNGWLIEPLSPAKCRVTAVSALDFGAWIHEKFTEGEVVRIAQRLTKIKHVSIQKTPK